MKVKRTQSHVAALVAVFKIFKPINNHFYPKKSFNREFLIQNDYCIYVLYSVGLWCDHICKQQISGSF